MTHIPTPQDLERARRYVAQQQAKRDGSASFALRRDARQRALLGTCPGMAPANMAMYMDMTHSQFQAGLEELQATPKAAHDAAHKGSGSALINNARNRYR